MKHLLLSIFFLLPFLSNGQKESYDSLKVIIGKDLNLLNSYNYFDSIYENLDIDSFAIQTAKKLVKLLSYKESKELKSKPLNNLDLKTSYGDSVIRIYEFSYSSGGTRGSISHPIIQWQRKDGSVTAYNLSKIIYSSFSSIEKLSSGNRELYLLLGTEKGNSSHIIFTAFIIQLNKDYLIIDYPAFFGSSYISLSNVEMDFNKKSGIMKLTSWDGMIEDNLLHMKYDYPSAYEELIHCFNDEGFGKLKFNGQKFIR